MANEIIYGLITFELYLYGVFACAIVLTAKLTFIYMILIDVFRCWPLCVCVSRYSTHTKRAAKNLYAVAWAVISHALAFAHRKQRVRYT